MRLKVSLYNYFFEAADGYMLAYNAFSNNFARVSMEKYRIIQNILMNPNQDFNNSKEKNELKNDLIKGHFLIEEELDEVELLKVSNKVGRFKSDQLILTIAPTLSCCFSCPYCFEERKRDTMSRDIEKAVIEFVEKRINQIKFLYVHWFGGEPTLRLDIINRLTSAFKKLCDSNHVNFPPMSIITNGYLLTKKNAQRLKDMNILKTQVTIDGPPHIHDLRRKLKNGKGSFWKIIENIKESKDILNIYIRINIDKENFKNILQLIDILKENGLLNKIPFYFGQIQSNTDSCADISVLCFNTQQFSKKIVNLLKKCRERGITNIKYPSSQFFGYCSADKLNSFVISPSGNLYKCWCEISSDEKDSIGNILNNNSNANQLRNLCRYLNWDPFKNKQCIECKYLPICMGGCPYNGLKITTRRNCTNYKYNLMEMLKLKYTELSLKKSLDKNIKKGG